MQCENSAPPGGVSVSIYPASAALEVGGHFPFVAVVNGASDTRVIWRVNGIPGGDGTAGAVTKTGTYAAPASVPNPAAVQVEAVAAADPTRIATATVAIAPAAHVRILYEIWEPRVIVPGSTTSMKLAVVITGAPTSVDIELLSGGVVLLSSSAANVYETTLSAADVLNSYKDGDDHTVVGYLNVWNNATRVSRSNLVANVRTPAIPDVHPVPVSPSIQVSDHIFNMQVSEPIPIPRSAAEILGDFYEYMQDNFDFVAIVSQVTFPENRVYVGVKNDTGGVGAALFDKTPWFGSAGRLQGVVQFPIDSYYDAGETVMAHELGHRWMNYLNLPALAAGGSHWPLSDIAYGIMGLSISGGEGGAFPFKLLEQPDGGYVCQFAGAATEFNDLELYLMGLVAPSQVSEHLVFQDQNQPFGGPLHGPVLTVAVQDIVAAAGPRLPPAGQAQTHFRLATIVLSRNRLLAADEMAFFEHMAARGEATTELLYTSGLARGVTKPFHLATRELATLSTTIGTDLK